MFWVTRARPVIDRIACPWLIVRFIDADAQFLFVAADHVLETAASVGGRAFDIEGAHYTHKEDECTFDALLSAHKLTADPALGHLAQIVRAADTNSLGNAAEAAGLLAISFGLRRLHTRDPALIEAGFLLYDALYAWCQHDRGAIHDWTYASVAK
jgi:hypothetical protein